FRLMQGVFGAPLVPLSQSVLLDIYPRERHGEAMAIWGMGVMVGPIFGPSLGGWLTEDFHWRWVFYINLPIGILTFVGLVAFIERPARDRRLRMDWFGFAMLSLAVGSFQLMLDRGEHLDWFSSREIILEAAIAGVAFYLFLAHVATAERPFIDLTVFRDRNLATGLVLICLTGYILFGSMALLTPFMQQLLGYPILTSAYVLAPRGLGTAVAMFIVGRIIRRVDIRLIMVLGYLCLSTTLYDMSTYTLEVPINHFMISGFIQGMGFGFCFVPISTLCFSTLAPEHRPQGTSIFSMMRNMGGSVGISVSIFMLGRFGQASRSDLVAHVTPFAPGVQARVMPDAWNPDTLQGLAGLEAEVVRQATAMAYFADYQILALIAALGIPLLCLARPPRH
ncbi:MAG: DHA2 family efflux MFS transporter permease subunit, partial [Alphaproteobacteria bacterium]